MVLVAEAAPETTAKVPPEIPAGKRRIWTGKKWALEDLPPPSSVSMRQARLALLQAGLLEKIQAAIAGAGQAAAIEFEFAQTVDRDWPLLQQLAPALGLDTAALDALFKAAAGY